MSYISSLFARFKKSIGPGVITGIADDDPSGIATYAQTGAMFGYGQLWFALYCLPFMTAIQEMCGRIGLVTGKGLAAIIKKHYSYKLLIFSVGLLAIANIINIGADLGAMADAVTLLIPIPSYIPLITLTCITIALEIFVPYKAYVKVLKYFAVSVFAYVLAAFFIKQPWGDVAFATLIPNIVFDKVFLLNIIALLGTTISPYLFFWQTSEEVEEKIVHTQRNDFVPEDQAVSQMRYDTALGMLISNIITFFIIITASATLHRNGIFEVTSAAQMAEALRPFAGDFAFLLFTIAIIGTGLLAIPVLAGSLAYAIAETFDWEEGLGKTFFQAKAFYTIIVTATALGILMNFSSIGSITMLYYAAVVNGVLAPPIMILIMLISNNKSIMGKHVNGKKSNILGWTITILMSVAALLFLFSFI